LASVTLENIVKRYGTVTAVRNLNLEIRDGEFMVLVGPSGCGKTTALRMIAGLEDISDGLLKIADKVVNDVEPRDRDIAMVFQNYALYPHMNCYQNMAFGLKLRKLPKAEIDRRVNEAATQLGIEALLLRKPKELSGGQRQRVALGRAIVREPQVFLMDEPLSNLDAMLRVQTRAELIKLHRRLKVTTIYVTHDQVEAMTMGQRIAVMKDGVLQQCDTPSEIYAHPVNLFVASFIGTPSMNFAPATLQKDAFGKHIINAGSFTIDAPTLSASVASQWIGKAVTVGIRPSDIFDRSLRNAPDATPGNSLEVLVDVVESMGDLATLYLTIGGQQLIATVPGDSIAKEGQMLSICIDTTRCHIFDPESQQAVA
jgi:multiple sugar transport system ATP-binding protein